MFSIHLLTVYYYINYLIQVFLQTLDSHMRNMKRPKDCAEHAKNRDRGATQPLLK